MKKLLFISLLLISSLAYGQNDVTRTSPVGNNPATTSTYNKQSVRDANLTAVLNLRIPVYSSFSIRNAKDSIGYVMYNTSISRMGVYKGSGQWDTLSTTSGSALINYYTKTQSDARYPLLNGTGATGTWGIGITGNASTVTNGVYTTTFNSLGDARYPLLSGGYSNPSWITSLAWSKITFTPTTLSGYGILDAGTVTNVSALTLGTTGTDLSSSVATGTTTPVITLNVPTASATNRGALSSADWTTFNNKASTASLANYVLKAGDTMTGTLNGTTVALTPTSTNYGLVINRSGSNASPISINDAGGSSNASIEISNTANTNSGGVESIFSGTSQVGTGFRVTGNASYSGSPFTYIKNGSTLFSVGNTGIITGQGVSFTTGSFSSTITAADISGNNYLFNNNNLNTIGSSAGNKPANIYSYGFNLSGATSGMISILGQAAAGTYNFNLPTTAGTSGQVLTSGGGVGSPMTWTTPTTGTVTAIGVTTANGVSGTSSGGSTPNLTISLGAITPSSVTASGTVTGSNLSGTNTGDQTITLTGAVTGSGTGLFATTIPDGSITNTKLTASTISGISLGSNLPTLTFGTYLTGTSYNGSTATSLGVTASTIGGASSLVATDGSSNITGSAYIANGSSIFTATNQAAAAVYGTLANTSGSLLYGVYNSAGTGFGSTVISGMTANATGFGTTTATPVQIFTNGVVRQTIGSTGATTYTGALTASNLSGTNTGDQTITLTGAVTGSGTSSFTTTLGSFSSANLATALLDETGSGSAVFATSPSFTTPTIGVATGTSLSLSGNISAGNIASGNYTPTGTNVQNFPTFTTRNFNYLRVGNTVFCAGTVLIDPTSTGIESELALTLPIASNFTTGVQLNGSAVSHEGGLPYVVYSDTVNDRAVVYGFPSNAAAQTWQISFSYEIL